MSESCENAKKLLKLFGPKGEHWTTGVFAKTRTGKETEVRSRTAHKWCLVGGCWKLGMCSDFLKKSLGSPFIAAFNDRDGFAPVKKLLQQIARGK